MFWKISLGTWRRNVLCHENYVAQTLTGNLRLVSYVVKCKMGERVLQLYEEQLGALVSSLAQDIVTALYICKNTLHTYNVLIFTVFNAYFSKQVSRNFCRLFFLQYLCKYLNRLPLQHNCSLRCAER